MIKYEVIIYWSEEDEAFVAEVPELPGCMAHAPRRRLPLATRWMRFACGSTLPRSLGIRFQSQRAAA